MARTNQGGSVLGYAVVAIVLAILLVGGAYTLNRMTVQPEAVQEPIAPAPESTEGDKPAEEKDKTPAEAPKPEKEPQKDTKEEAAPRETPTAGPSDTLPETGPSDLLVSAVMLGLLSAAGVSYVRSRRFAVSL